MRFIFSAILALATITSTVVAQNNPNAFIKPDGSSVLQAGQETTITWTPGSPGPITLRLRKGPSKQLQPGSIIAGGISNSGSFVWLIPKDTPAGNDYAITITDDGGAVLENFTAQFTIVSDVTSSSSASTSTDSSSSEAKTTTPKPTGTHTKPNNSTVTTHTGRPNNSTAITRSSNATATASGSTETETSPTETTKGESSPTGSEPAGSSPSSTSTSGAISLLKSPLALVVCVLGAVFYLN